MFQLFYKWLSERSVKLVYITSILVQVKFEICGYVQQILWR